VTVLRFIAALTGRRSVSQVFMISYMIDKVGYLIVNREVVGGDIGPFEYNPKPEFEGVFSPFNAATVTHTSNLCLARLPILGSIPAAGPTCALLHCTVLLNWGCLTGITRGACNAHAGPFTIFNEPDERATLRRWFDHMRQVRRCASDHGSYRS